MEKVTKKHRKPLRLKDYDYSQAGAYFVTLCTNDRECIFENIHELNHIVQTQWNELEVRFPEIKLDEFVIMPNHIHGIIFIVGAIHELPLQNRKSTQPYRRKMLLPKVIGFFKTNTAKEANQILNRTGQPFWQRNYYEHIIRSQKELNRIKEYILNNPLKWELDRENPISKNFNLDHDTYWKEVPLTYPWTLLSGVEPLGGKTPAEASTPTNN